MSDLLQYINEHFKVLSAIAWLAGMGFMAWMTTKFVTRSEHSQLKAEVGKIGGRVASIEKDLQHMPSKEDVHRLDKSINSMLAMQEATKESITRLERKTDLLVENELRGD